MARKAIKLYVLEGQSDEHCTGNKYVWTWMVGTARDCNKEKARLEAALAATKAEHRGLFPSQIGKFIEGLDPHMDYPSIIDTDPEWTVVPVPHIGSTLLKLLGY